MNYDHRFTAEDALWSVTLRDIPLWGLVRSRLYMYSQERESDYQALSSASNRVHLQTRRLPRYASTLRWLAFSRKRWDTLFLTRNVNRLPVDARCSFDRMYRPYYERIAHPLILERTLQADWPLPDCNHVTLSQDLLWIIANRLGDTLPMTALTTTENVIINDFVAQVIHAFETPELEDELRQTLTTLLRRVPMTRAVVERLLVPRIRQTVAFVHGAAYLGHRAIITQTLHAHGVRVAEIQHGFVSRIHYAYNYPPAVLDNPAHPARPLLPDLFLTYGAYWSQVVRMPSQQIVVGSPYVSQLAAEASSGIEADQRQILLVSSYIVTDRTVALARHLAENLTGYRIIVKLHPQEIAQQPEIEEALAGSGVQVIGNANVYTLIAQSGIIASWYATTILAEAVAFSGKRLFCAETGTYPAAMTTPFTTSEELAQLIKSPDRGYPEVEPGQFWASDWQQRLDEFLGRYLYGSDNTG